MQINLAGVAGSTSYFDFDFSNYNNGNLMVMDIAAVPEPATLSLAGLAAIGLLLRRRRR